MSQKQINELYGTLDASSKKLVNKLIRVLHRENVDDDKKAALSRSVNRLTRGGTKKRKINGYIVYYKQMYHQFERENPGARLGEIAKLIGASWRKLGKQEQQKYSSPKA